MKLNTLKKILRIRCEYFTNTWKNVEVMALTNTIIVKLSESVETSHSHFRMVELPATDLTKYIERHKEYLMRDFKNRNKKRSTFKM